MQKRYRYAAWRPLTTILLMTCTLSAEVLFKADFSSKSVGDKPSADKGVMTLWTGGTEEKRGKFSIESPILEGVEKINALAFGDSSLKGGPVCTIHTADYFLNKVGSKKGEVHLKFLVPIEGTFRGIIYLGGYWKESAVTLVLNNGNLTYFRHKNGREEYVKVAEYRSNCWEELKIVFHFKDQTYDLIWNGEEVLAGEAWVNSDCVGKSILIEADASQVDRGGAWVFYLNEIEVSFD